MAKEKIDRRVFENETGVQGQYKNWFLEYASYVILERAVPALEDGLKPVQRRILHSMKEMDDGRFNKVANIIGQSMQYHPHGDASIGDALVNLGQKDLLIETQGNWGDVRTGDAAAASRYIEARLSKFALEVAFNAKTTEWQLSYDGRKNEPVNLPMKFPLLLAQGADGIAVGLSTKILPHNFCELIDASIKYLRGKKFELFPDFQTGGMIDVSGYNEGKRGGKVRVRAHVEELDKKTLVIRDVPYGVTTTQLMESITKANDQGKIKIKKVTDVTAKDVEIQIDLAAGISPDITIDALYAFTDCEVSISPNACVIENHKPRFMGVQELLRCSVDNTKHLLKRELEIKLGELEDKWHYTSLEKIFFEEKIYKELEQKHETWEHVIEAIDKGFAPFKKKLKRAIEREDILKLTEKPVRRIYRLDINELNQQIKGIEADIQEVNHHLENLTDYAVAYYDNLLKKFGKGRERKTEIKEFDTIQVKQVAIANTKLYINRAEGFIGTGLKKDEFLCECSDYDDIIAFTKTGTMKVVKVSDKTFIGKDIIHAAIFEKNDERTTYNMIYLDGKSGVSYAKRFNVTGVTREKEYDLTKGSEKSKVHYLTANPNGEAETLKIILSPNCTARIKELDFYFEELEIKGRSSMGNQVTKYPIKTVKLKEAGKSTLAGRKLWFDDKFGRLNTEEKGQYLGMFEDEKIIVIYNDGSYELTDTEITQRFEPEKIALVEQFNPEKNITAVYLDADKGQYNIKRFKIETTTLKTQFVFIKEGKDNRLEAVTTEQEPILVVQTGRGQQVRKAKFKVAKMVEVMGWKAVGAKLTDFNKSIEMEWEVRPPSDTAQTELF
ncbi:MAG: DNA topoisomerase IV [Sphingobacteriia bacterium 24-36-13]|jgi:topoisomerase-4 subunit A|uniref:DNA gyrase/topoisomerase IV subunit A n=1 Tax=Sediminibacterium sp. TaxID=1917865 RepID=UPI000BC8E08F|nr:DNA gyrase/topoisomerase IV subunit A [Sediminibacterium sp.]OYY11869.1 MAG: DNA topoisomerase IV [Sphingobacteriia bacterium 35-36-14]OYZ54565.1 MAG: DNA topoisomerase IV [Sphingobacteriia bacterium 24-36-13]OZA64414.1 MAG: DNA topoisomerase IV [Sphingobacteriia bacterium 39-36-14]HQS24476.1 DNA gyrase/topoisomerase IV subunit A [Sediminibacterium sp.]HQS35255.1 DNA gyrase/topoisomerase IV subunit A [Sediminibacterium sp.]